MIGARSRATTRSEATPEPIPDPSPGSSAKTRPSKAELGALAETLACAHLVDRGFEIVARNARVGRLELDIIARRGNLVVFCEVRARSSDRLMTPAQSITPAKIERVRRAAVHWLKQTERRIPQVRFDVASVVFDTPGGRLNYLEGAF